MDANHLPPRCRGANDVALNFAIAYDVTRRYPLSLPKDVPEATRVAGGCLSVPSRWVPPLEASAGCSNK